jgi:hypothetical protein
MPEDQIDEIEAVAGLLMGKPEKAEETTAPEKDEAGDTNADTPEKVEGSEAEAPEKDGLDYGMKVPITGGDPVTLGDLKDAYQNQKTAQLELIERENSVLRDREQANMLLSYVADLPEHIKQAAAQQAVVDYRQQMAILTEAIPEARTPEGAAHMKDVIYALTAEYGVARRDVDQIKNAVTVKMLYDFARLRADIRAAKANVKPLRSAEVKGQSAKTESETQQLISKAKQTRNSQDEASAVAALLRSKA